MYIPHIKRNSDELRRPMTLPEVIQNSDPDGTRLDVVVNGYVVPLPSLKKALRKMRVTQEDLASHSRLHQSTVSTHLNGVTDMAPELLVVIEEHFLESDLDMRDLEGAHPVYDEEGLNNPNGGAVPLTPALQQAVNASPAMRDIFNILLKQKGPDPESYLSKVAREITGVQPVDPALQEAFRPAKVLTPFPMEEAHKLALVVRKDFEKGGVVRQNFSMRKLKLWGEAFYLLQGAGFTVDEALQGGYHASTVGKTLAKSEEREFLLKQFDIYFGSEPSLPKMNPNKARADGNRHPLDYVAEPLIRAGIPVWFAGESAMGKTWSAKSLAMRTAGGFIRMQGTQDTHEDDFVGGMAARDATTYFQYGPLPLAWQQGIKLIIDELSFIPSGSLSALQSVLEGDDLVIKANGGEHVPPSPGASIIVTDNTKGLGEGLSYVGTEVVNESIRDRFLMLEWDYLPPSQEKLAVEMHLNDLLNRNVWRTQ